MTVVILREECVEYSALQWLREKLPDYGFVLAPAGGANVRLREAFPTPDERQTELELTTVAFGFNIDDGGTPVELGSTLTEYVHTLEVWTFAIEPRIGKRVAHTIKHIVRHNDMQVPLRDYNQNENPVIDSLQVHRAAVQHQANSSAFPWDQFVWTTSISLADIYYP